MQLVNDSPLSAGQTIVFSQAATELLIVAIKGCWVFGQPRLTLAEDQEPIHPAPIFRNTPSDSSLICDSDLLPSKGGTDCLLEGTLMLERPQRLVELCYRAGPLSRRVRVFGDRYWEQRPMTYAQSEAEPFTEMPLTYERAFGGSDQGRGPAPAFWPENPVGIGYFAPGSQKKIEGSRLPNLEDSSEPVKDPAKPVKPAGLGAIAGHWQPRLSYAGTYDEAWHNLQAPLLPLDFDRRFLSCAPAGLFSPAHFTGKETIELVLGGTGLNYSFALPELRPKLFVKFGLKTLQVPVHLETVQLTLNSHRLMLLWKGEITLHQRLNQWAWTRVTLEKS